MAHRAHIVIPTENDTDGFVVENIKTFMSYKYGGCSTYEGSGCWNDDGSMVEEPHVRVVVTMPDDHAHTVEQFKETVRIEAEYVKSDLDQDAVLIEFESVDMELV